MKTKHAQSCGGKGTIRGRRYVTHGTVAVRVEVELGALLSSTFERTPQSDRQY